MRLDILFWKIREIFAEFLRFFPKNSQKIGTFFTQIFFTKCVIKTWQIYGKSLPIIANFWRKNVQISAHFSLILEKKIWKFLHSFRKFLRNNIPVFREFFENKSGNFGTFFAKFWEKHASFSQIFAKITWKLFANLWQKTCKFRRIFLWKN